MITFQNNDDKALIEDIEEKQYKKNLYIVPSISLEAHEEALYDTGILISANSDEFCIVDYTEADTQKLMTTLYRYRDGENIVLKLSNNTDETITTEENYPIASLILCVEGGSEKSEEVENIENVENTVSVLSETNEETTFVKITENIVYDDNNIVVQANSDNVVDNIVYQESSDGQKAIVINLL